MKKLSWILVLLAGLVAGAVPALGDVLPYDEQADVHATLRDALNLAQQSDKRVLIVFGANWCGDCKALDKAFHETATADMLSKRYVIVKIDVGHFDKNLDTAGIYGKPIAKGIPSVVVVTPKNEIVYATRAGELADARHMGSDGILNFFKDLSERPGGY